MMTLFIVALSALIATQYVIRELINGKRERALVATEKLIQSILNGTADPREQRKNLRAREWVRILDAWIALSQSVTPDETEQARITGFFVRRKVEMHYIRRLRSPSAFRRSEAAHYLGFIKTERTVRALSLSLRQEKKESVKLYIVSSLARLDASVALPDILDSIQGTSKDFIMRITGLLIDFQSSFIALFPQLESRRERELIELIVEYARLAPYSVFKDYLKTLFLDPATPEYLREKTFNCLVESYPFAIQPVEFITDANVAIRNRAYKAIGDRPGKVNALILLEAAVNDTKEGHALTSLSSMARRSASVFLFLLDMLDKTADERQIPILCRVLAGRIDYFLLKTGRINIEMHEKVIAQVLEDGNMSDLISFLNNNHDTEIENHVIAIIQKHLAKKSTCLPELRMYLKPEILHKIGLGSQLLPQRRINKMNETVNRGPLFAILIGAISVFPAIIALTLLRSPGGGLPKAIPESMDLYIRLFAWYCFFVNTFYFLLAFLANREARNQNRYHRIKDDAFLFRKNMLPSISIIAPAYNEETNIANSIESLLNVNYPDFEVIVVNDGSKDSTLATLITHFKLEKIDAVYSETLKTQPVRGMYRNPRIPALKVIDKINGGKADSLNVGINAASGEYILGIDSDSILERDSLLTLTSAFLDETDPVVASGGNIHPANGCVIDHGIILEKRVPRQAIPLVQTVEYLRAFMNGRTGWSRIRTLMIISGAFGLFRRKEVMDINGYLTSREKYEKDTVGEDMELVVRMSRHLREKKIRHRITYNFKANCWTEVPDSLKVLKRQRDRWQRGLIDIISFHKKMIFNPAYGTYGMIGFPYYIVVEIIGPWFELLGNIVFVAGLLAGVFRPSTIAFLLATNFLYSFALTLYALLISDTERPTYRLKDRIVIIVASLVETLGFRQLLSFFRITGYVGVLRKKKGWGAMTRKGFRTKGGKP